MDVPPELTKGERPQKKPGKNRDRIIVHQQPPAPSIGIGNVLDAILRYLVLILITPTLLIIDYTFWLDNCMSAWKYAYRPPYRVYPDYAYRPRPERVAIVVFILIAGGLGAWFSWKIRSGWANASVGFLVILILDSMLTLLLVLPWMQVRQRKLRSYVLAYENEVCMHCGYSLQGLPPVSKCPECGTKYELEGVTACWQDWLAESSIWGPDWPCL